MIRTLRRVLASLLHRYEPPGPPDDPSVLVREPRRRNPGGRSSSVALAEPEALSSVRAVGASGAPPHRRDLYEE
jgi:hypothetical protein